jgi:hypothetical protein
MTISRVLLITRTHRPSAFEGENRIELEQKITKSINKGDFSVEKSTDRRATSLPDISLHQRTKLFSVFSIPGTPLCLDVVSPEAFQQCIFTFTISYISCRETVAALAQSVERRSHNHTTIRHPEVVSSILTGRTSFFAFSLKVLFLFAERVHIYFIIFYHFYTIDAIDEESHFRKIFVDRF